MRIRAVLADDHRLFRAGLRVLLEEHAIEVVAEAPDGEQAVELAIRHSPDVVVMDLSMPGIGGVEATRRISRAVPGSRVLVLTITAEDAEVHAAIVAGAAGYLLKDEDGDEIVAGVRAAAAGHAQISPRVAAGLLNRVRIAGAERSPGELLAKLTEREVEVLRLLGRGRSNADIAAALHITSATAKNHVASILAKLGLENRTEAAVYAARDGLL